LHPNPSNNPNPNFPGPGVNALTINNLAGAEKRNLGSGYFIMLGTLGGIAGSFIFLARESPKYPTGFGTSLGFGLAGILCLLTVTYLYHRHNTKYADVDEEEIRAKYTPEELERMGDKSPLYKYSL
jgi:hypothetical protein